MQQRKEKKKNHMKLSFTLNEKSLKVLSISIFMCMECFLINRHYEYNIFNRRRV